MYRVVEEVKRVGEKLRVHCSSLVSSTMWARSFGRLPRRASRDFGGWRIFLLGLLRLAAGVRKVGREVLQVLETKVTVPTSQFDVRIRLSVCRSASVMVFQAKMVAALNRTTRYSATGRMNVLYSQIIDRSPHPFNLPRRAARRSARRS